ncbi:MAG: ParB/RepB/Spo0J family partition protein [Ruminococcaceae bacterium]|nr:ParB/RepB/Spo0J family partition protein [Oscillospiraceae bacterium]
MAAIKKGGLGRGLDALFNENATDEKGVVTLRLSEIEPNRNQPRTNFDEDALSELADSIAKHGLIQPIVVRPTSSGVYQIVAGERRWRACRMADIQEVPVVIKELDDQNYYEIALIENLQREDLNAVEEAQGYKTLIDVYNLTQEQVAESVGKSRSAVTNALRLLNLNDKALEALKNGDITAGHARAILAADSDEIAAEMLKAALAGASVRELEAMTKSKPKTTKKTPTAKKNFYSEVEISLKNELGRRVDIKSKGKGKGTITLEFYSDEELADFAKKLVGE